jgi:hypothetical protein
MGHRFVVTTSSRPDGTWVYAATLADDENRTSLAESAGDRFPTEAEAWRAGVSAAAGAIDRTRTTRGKP